MLAGLNALMSVRGAGVLKVLDYPNLFKNGRLMPIMENHFDWIEEINVHCLYTFLVTLIL